MNTKKVIPKKNKKSLKSKSFKSLSARKRFSVKSSYLASPSARNKTSAKSFTVAAKYSKKNIVTSKFKKAAAARLGEDEKSESDECALVLLNFPDEIKLEIFKNLPPQDLRAVSATCHQLHRLMQDPSLWTKITVDISESRRSLIWKVAKFPWLNTLIVTNKSSLNMEDSRHLNKIKDVVKRVPHFKKYGCGMNWESTGNAMILKRLP